MLGIAMYAEFESKELWQRAMEASFMQRGRLQAQTQSDGAPRRTFLEFILSLVLDVRAY